jgi:nucleotide-binding universal stress UspA family protein
MDKTNMRVLVATDGSSAADRAIGLASSMAWPAGTQVRVVTVIEPVPPVPLAEWAGPGAPAEGSYPPEAEKVAKALLDGACAQFAHTPAEASGQTLYGRAATCIVESARAFKADLVIVGSRGHGTIASMVLGSVGAEVADQADCPVLIARDSHLTRAVLGVDESEFSRAAEKIIAEWPIFAKVAVEVTHVAQTALPWMVALGPGVAVPPDVGPDEYEAVGAATRRLKEAGRHAFGRMVMGDPATGLLLTAEQAQADLIVVGTHGRTGLSRAVFGSVARNVMLHAPCSVLVVRKIRGSEIQLKAA